MKSTLLKSLVASLVSIIALSLISVPDAHGQSKRKRYRIAQKAKKVKKRRRPAQKEGKDAERVDVDAIKEKYWARGDESQLGVVQNRLFSKAGKFQIGVFGGIIYSDPFLQSNPYGFNIGYHFSELFGVHFVGYNIGNSASSALTAFQEKTNGDANTNLPLNFMGLETTFSMLYGKLSVLGMAIIYYDLHLSVGAGRMNTESGANFAPTLGIGQRFFLTKMISFRFDYRMVAYREEILEKVVPTQLGESRGFRNNFSNTITFGLDFMF